MTLGRLRHRCLTVPSTFTKLTVNQRVAPIQGSPYVWPLPCPYLVCRQSNEKRRKQNVNQDFQAGECCDNRNSGGGCAGGRSPDCVESVAEERRNCECSCGRSGPFATGRNARESNVRTKARQQQGLPLSPATHQGGLCRGGCNQPGQAGPVEPRCLARNGWESSAATGGGFCPTHCFCPRA